MSQAKAIAKYIRVPPQKARLVADLIRGLSVAKAEEQLAFCPNKAGRYFKKVLGSAVANAEMQLDMHRDSLFVEEVRVDQGPTLKRSKSRSKGSRAPVLKRTSHLVVAVAKMK